MKTTTKVFATLAIVLTLFGVTMVLEDNYFSHFDYNLVTANQLAEKPQDYVTVLNPDTVLLQAILNLGEPIPCQNVDDTLVGSLLELTDNIEYQDNYYSISIDSVEPNLIYGIIYIAALCGFIVSGILLVSYALLRGIRYAKKLTAKSKQNTDNTDIHLAFATRINLLDSAPKGCRSYPP